MIVLNAGNVVSLSIQTYNMLPASKRKLTEFGRFAVVNGVWVKVKLER